MTEKGCLYLCATPIGNLEDITLRALRILKEVDLIAAEDTRHTQKLLNYYEIKKPLTSYHKFNKETKGKILLEKLLSQKKIALVSDAGMPGISDPGYELVVLALKNNIEVVPIPGPSAVTTALSASGLDTSRFYFEGFLPSKKSDRERALEEIKNYPFTLVFYESPHRINSFLESLLKIFGDRKIVVAREVTKKFEEFLRGSISEIREHFKKTPPKGEFTVIVEGAKNFPEEKGATDIEKLAEEVLKNTAQGANKKEEIKRLAKEAGIPKRDLYEMVVKLEGKK